MSNLKLDQLQYEAGTWKRSLEYIIEENIHLKKRLSEILKNGYDADGLEAAEYFQNQFIKQDDFIGIIRDDLSEIDNYLFKKGVQNGNANEFNGLFERLRNNIHHLETNFTKVKLDFNHYLQGVLIKT